MECNKNVVNIMVNKWSLLINVSLYITFNGYPFFFRIIFISAIINCGAQAFKGQGVVSTYKGRNGSPRIYTQQVQSCDEYNVHYP